jgi:aminopeptidase N
LKSILPGLTILFAFFILSCNSNKKLVVPIEPDYESVTLDTLTISGDKEEGLGTEEDEFAANPYQAAATRYFDLLHTKLNLKFDWQKQFVIGTAEIDATPLAYAQDSLVLDAKGMQINGVTLRDSKTTLSFRNTGSQVIVKLDKTYTLKDIVKISIDYIAKPNEGPVGGSAAITSDKGLFFINPNNEEVGKPQQIWTQGETENNSRWFPTFDKPNERCTQELTLTVEDKYVTLSNGKLVSSQKNADGTRTDYWKQDKAHAPYLFMIAVGEYAVIEDKWENLPLQYYVEKPYAPYAKQIFNHTPEMLGFFSNLFKYKFPWDKYSQVITRDYVSGAMENTSAVIFGDFIQKTDRELIDNDNDLIIAHELSHHWFGDLVTTESWSNLTLNEGFANYSEYLWAEYKYGKSRADEHRQIELNGYLTSTYNGGMHPLIHYRYANREDMFDAHSYNKGGLVLHYLRSYLGDEVFFKSLNLYLEKYQYTAVEVDELRMAFEDTSGEDLHWFFDQWYLRKGHPEFNVSYAYNAAEKELNVKIMQDPANVFKLPVDVAIYDNAGKVEYKRLWTKTGEDNVVLTGINVAPAAIVFDGKSVIPGQINETKTAEEWLATFLLSNQFSDKYQAMQSIANEDAIKEKLIDKAINDPYYYFRDYAVNTAALMGLLPKYKDKVVQMMTNDAHSQVRESALRSLVIYEDIDKGAILKSVFAKEKAFNVLGEALSQQQAYNSKDAIEYCTLLEKENVVTLDNKIAAIYAETSDPKYNAWYANKIKSGNPYALFELCGYYNIYLLSQSESDVKKAIELYASLGKNQNSNKYNRYIGTASLFSMKNMLIYQKMEKGKDSAVMVKLISDQIKAIKVMEKDEELIERYAEF